MMSYVFSDASALFLMWVFAQAGLHKVQSANGAYYANLIAQYLNLEAYLDHSAQAKSQFKLLAKGIGIVEVTVALALVIPSTRAVAAMLAIVILVSYLLLMAFQIVQGNKELDCGCMGPAGQTSISGSLLLRNSIFSVLAWLCLAPGNSFFTSAMVMTIVISLVMILLNLTFEQLIVNAQRLKVLSH
ncbi:MauE/DoxX family redox-associated membrane protein [Candidatus Colwellia aromaticivorans]|uniref:MauE/DoxX family redox-associated membrane protein n=1 Tax=Candidatus Colwellia aromaticivorans TaxID=2267621 RepID=UPI000DF25D7C|nr:MauE/DoxX family redox-associated membrane protein [Candidatus Colwellia aromaticivorans]